MPRMHPEAVCIPRQNVLYLARFCMKYALFRSFLHEKRRFCLKNDISQKKKEEQGSGNDWFVSNSLLYLNTNLFNYISLLITLLITLLLHQKTQNMQKSILL